MLDNKNGNAQQKKLLVWKLCARWSLNFLWGHLGWTFMMYNAHCPLEYRLPTEATIKCSGCGIALLAVSYKYSHFKPFPAHIRKTRRFSHFFAQFGASRTIFCKISSIKPTIYWKIELSLDNWGEFRQNWVQFRQLGWVKTKNWFSQDNWDEFRQKLGSVYTIESSLNKKLVEFRQ